MGAERQQKPNAMVGEIAASDRDALVAFLSSGLLRLQAQGRRLHQHPVGAAYATHLFGRGKMLMRVDAKAPIDGLPGKCFDGMEPRYCKGAPPRLGDLACTQMAMRPFIRATAVQR
jgi:hypothetical protein